MGGGRKSNVEKPALNKRQEKILEILAGGESLSANEIFDQLDDVASLRTVKADLAALKKLCNHSAQDRNVHIWPPSNKKFAENCSHTDVCSAFSANFLFEFGANLNVCAILIMVLNSYKIVIARTNREGQSNGLEG